MSKSYDEKVAGLALEEHEGRESARKRIRELRKHKKATGKPKSLRARRYADKQGGALIREFAPDGDVKWVH